MTRKISFTNYLPKNAELFGVFFIFILTTLPCLAKTDTAIFAGGCFWCMEPPFDALPGVEKTVSGYTGGSLENPTYQLVTRGGTGHYEAVKVYYDPNKISYEKLLQVFWRNVDPLDNSGQFCDRGASYRTAIFTNSKLQRELAVNSKARLKKIQKFQGVVTPILIASKFYPAEQYHQNYYQKNPVRYKFYRYTCGRDKRLNELWDNVDF